MAAEEEVTAEEDERAAKEDDADAPDDDGGAADDEEPGGAEDGPTSEEEATAAAEDERAPTPLLTTPDSTDALAKPDAEEGAGPLELTSVDEGAPSDEEGPVDVPVNALLEAKREDVSAEEEAPADATVTPQTPALHASPGQSASEPQARWHTPSGPQRWPTWQSPWPSQRKRPCGHADSAAASKTQEPRRGTMMKRPYRVDGFADRFAGGRTFKGVCLLLARTRSPPPLHLRAQVLTLPTAG